MVSCRSDNDIELLLQAQAQHQVSEERDLAAATSREAFGEGIAQVEVARGDIVGSPASGGHLRAYLREPCLRRSCAKGEMLGQLGHRGQRV